MTPNEKNHIIHLFNEGILTEKDADFYHKQGYAIICEDGIITDIVKDL